MILGLKNIKNTPITKFEKENTYTKEHKDATGKILSLKLTNERYKTKKEKNCT